MRVVRSSLITLNEFESGRMRRTPIDHVHENLFHSHYLPYVDGLRAVAILFVVGFHVGIPGLGGGFVGVDVFFVISGYLITRLLACELVCTGKINILSFYARRAKRLLPALTLVLLATLAGGAVFLLPIGEQQDLAISAMAASAFVANIFFWRTQSDYFAGPSEEMPLLHLWTLAVEEQFYIAWPLLVLAIGSVAWRCKQRPGIEPLIGLLILCSLLSFIACWWLTPVRWTLAFYNMPFRAWEFGIGAIIALLGIQVARSSVGRKVGGITASIGLGMIIAAGILFDSTMLFPGVSAALPVVGSGAIMLGLAKSPGSFVGRVLATPLMTGIGKVSYSWYLWHWPLLALARAHALGEPSLSRDLGLSIIALALSIITYLFVEEPVRRRKFLLFARPVSSILGGIALMSLTTSAAAALWVTGMMELARNPKMRAAADAMDVKVDLPIGCSTFNSDFTGLPPRSECFLGSNPLGPLTLLWGDSHAHHFIPALQDWAQATGARVLPRVLGACKPTFNEVPDAIDQKQLRAAHNCVAYNQAVAAELLELKAEGAIAVILSARWAVPSPLQTGLGDWEEALLARISEIRRAGLEVIIMAEVPRPFKRVPQCSARQDEEACDRPRADVDVERQAMIAVLKRVVRISPGVSFIDPAEALCDSKTCGVTSDTTVLYKDDHHLSVAGAKRLADPIGIALHHLSGAD